MEVIKSNKGALKVIHDCYMYTKKICSSRKAKSCKGGIATNLEISDVLNITPQSSWRRTPCQLYQGTHESKGCCNWNGMRRLWVPSLEESVLRKQPHLKRFINHWKAKVTTNNASDMEHSSCVSSSKVDNTTQTDFANTSPRAAESTHYNSALLDSVVPCTTTLTPFDDWPEEWVA